MDFNLAFWRKKTKLIKPKTECCGQPVGYHTWQCTRTKWEKKNGF